MSICIENFAQIDDRFSWGYNDAVQTVFFHVSCQTPKFFTHPQWGGTSF